MNHLGKVSGGQRTPSAYIAEARTTAYKFFQTYSDKTFVSTLHSHLDFIQEL